MWREYCDSHPCPPLDNLDTQSRDTEFMLLRRLGWIKNTKNNINLLTLTVKQATWLGTKNNRLYLMDHHRSFHIAAFQDPPSRLVFDTTFAAFPATLRRLWIIPWENSHKEAYWRLALDAFENIIKFGRHRFDIGRKRIFTQLVFLEHKYIIRQYIRIRVEFAERCIFYRTVPTLVRVCSTETDPSYFR